MNVIYHSGGCGDILYGLPAIKAIGGGILVSGMPMDRHIYLKPLLEAQSYIKEVRHVTETDLPKGFINMDAFRGLWNNKTHLTNLHLKCFGFPDYDFESGGWLETDNLPDISSDIRFQDPYAVINVTPRYRDRFFVWGRHWSGECFEVWGRDPDIKKIVYIGDKEEYKKCDWIKYGYGMVGDLTVKHIKTRDATYAAAILKKAVMFSGNQSMMLALRQSLGLPYRFEQAPFHVDTTQHSKHETVLNPMSRRLHIFCFGVKNAFKKY